MTNREYKFRIWNGTEMVYDVMVGKFGVFYVNPSNNGLDVNDSACLTRGNTKYDSNIPVMEFTRRKDVNGVEIYEGDILKIPGDTLPNYYEVVWNQRTFKFDLKIHQMHYKLIAACKVSNYETLQVLGNIYKDPKLIQKYEK